MFVGTRAFTLSLRERGGHSVPGLWMVESSGCHVSSWGSLGPYPHSKGYGRGGMELFGPSCAWAPGEGLSGQIHRPQSPLPAGYPPPGKDLSCETRHLGWGGVTQMATFGSGGGMGVACSQLP